MKMYLPSVPWSTDVFCTSVLENGCSRHWMALCQLLQHGRWTELFLNLSIRLQCRLNWYPSRYWRGNRHISMFNNMWILGAYFSSCLPWKQTAFFKISGLFQTWPQLCSWSHLGAQIIWPIGQNPQRQSYTEPGQILTLLYMSTLQYEDWLPHREKYLPYLGSS